MAEEDPGVGRRSRQEPDSALAVRSMSEDGRTGSVVIEARRSWRQLGLRELWARRELLYFLVWRDLKVRYRQTAFGVAWALVQPILLMAVFAVSVGQLPGIAPPGVRYPLFALAGLVPWVMFAQAVTSASNSLVGAEAVITKVYFPRLLLPFSAVASFVLDFLIGTVLLLVIQGAAGQALLTNVFALPGIALLVLISALGVGTLLSAVNVRYRDVRHALPFLIQVWLFASPVVYASSLIPPSLRPLYAVNPMAGAIDGFRWALLGGSFPLTSIVISTASAILILTFALLYFRRVERTFADVI
jgi:lipopolysaccharide transport system permease protein